MGASNEFKLFKGNDCPICRGEHKSCRTSPSGRTIHCRSFNTPPTGYRFLKEDGIGFGIYALEAEGEGKYEKKERQIPQLSLQERDRKIRSYSGNLSDRQIADLLGRGLEAKQISYAIEHHWLFKLEGGYGIAAIDPTTGLLVGAQRANDNRELLKYSWGVFAGDNSLKETNENPLFTWVNPKFDPAATYEIKYAEGALKSMVRAILEWKTNKNVIVVGAAGGIFGKNSLARLHAKFPNASAHTLLCDAESCHVKKLNILSAYKNLAANIPAIAFADWGQWENKEKKDCDETFGTPAFNEYERRSPDDWLEFWREEDLLNLANDPTGNIDPESFVIGQILAIPSAIAKVKGIIISPEAFLDPLNREIYAAFLQLDREGVLIDVLSTHNALTTKGVGDKISQRYLLALQNRIAEFQGVNVESQAKILGDRHILKSGQKLGEELVTLFRDESDVNKAFNQAQYKFTNFTSAATPRNFVNAGTLLREQIAKIEKEKADSIDGDIQRYITVGIPEFDEVCPIEVGSFVGVIACSSNGKTTFAFFAAQHIAAFLRQTVLIVSLEVGGTRTASKFALMETGYSYRAIKSNNFVIPEHKENFDKVVGAYEAAGIYVYDSSPVVEDICAQVKAHYVENGEKTLTLVIDYFQLMTPARLSNDPKKDHDYCLKAIDRLRKELNITVIMLIQPVKDLENRTDKRPDLVDTLGTAFVRQVLDLGFYLYIDQKYNKQSYDRGRIEIGGRKSRDGNSNWVIKPNFYGAQSRIGDSFVSILDILDDPDPLQEIGDQDGSDDELWQDF